MLRRQVDGIDYPVQGDPGHTMASLKRIGNDTIAETDKRDGKVVGVFKMTVSPDGRRINVEYKNKERGMTTTYKMEKPSQATNTASANFSRWGPGLQLFRLQIVSPSR